MPNRTTTDHLAGTPTKPETRIIKDAPYVTVIDFLHVEAEDQDEAAQLSLEASGLLAGSAGLLGHHVLKSVDGSRVVNYAQWQIAEERTAAEARPAVSAALDQARRLTENGAAPRDYTVVYTDDRSPAGISVISTAYTGAIFINEITTHPDTQDRLLELVIANNEIQSQSTPGYRSANFHQSIDGHRAVNYSLWDTAEHCIEAISAMADMDENLAETVEIANPDFRFYILLDPL